MVSSKKELEGAKTENVKKTSTDLSLAFSVQAV
jgi:hypothetical protein